MSTNVFVDTNVFIYAQIAGTESKHSVACDLLKKQLLNKNIFISTQVLGEVYSAMRKYKRTHAEITHLLNEMIQGLNIAMVSLVTVRRGLTIVEKYGYSYWDSLLLAVAVENDCDIFYSEDMQHNHIIEGKLTIRNPFADRIETHG